MSRQVVKPAISVTRALRAPQSAAWPRRRLDERLLPVHAVAVGEVRVEVDEPGQQRRRAQVDDARARRDGQALPSLRCGRLRPAPCAGRTAAAAPVDEARGLEDECFRAGSGGERPATRNASSFVRIG